VLKEGETAAERNKLLNEWLNTFPPPDINTYTRANQIWVSLMTNLWHSSEPQPHPFAHAFQLALTEKGHTVATTNTKQKSLYANSQSIAKLMKEFFLTHDIAVALMAYTEDTHTHILAKLKDPYGKWRQEGYYKLVPLPSRDVFGSQSQVSDRIQPADTIDCCSFGR
jgi:hypothetical protein